MYGERTIWLDLDNQQIDLQFLYRIAQRIASNASHDTPLDFYFVLGKEIRPGPPTELRGLWVLLRATRQWPRQKVCR